MHHRSRIIRRVTPISSRKRRSCDLGCMAAEESRGALLGAVADRVQQDAGYAGQHIDMDSGAYTRAFTIHFAYRFGGYKEKTRKKVDTSRFGH